MTTIRETGVYAVPVATQHLGTVKRHYDEVGIHIDIKVVCGTIPDSLDIIVFRRDLVTCDWCLRDEASG